MASSTSLTVSNESEFKEAVNRHLSKGFSKAFESNGSFTLSRKKPFNWILAIICLFIPIIGWIALIMMILAANRGSEVIEIIRNY